MINDKLNTGENGVKNEDQPTNGESQTDKSELENNNEWQKWARLKLNMWSAGKVRQASQVEHKSIVFYLGVTDKARDAKLSV